VTDAPSRALICVEPATPPRLELRARPLPRPEAGQVRVRVAATSVNPIDAKRAAGYGLRLLGLKGAASFPLVLGNDVAGTVEAVGAGVSRFAPGQRVFGLLATGKNGGAHAKCVIVPQEQLARAPEDVDFRALAVLPYSFTTMWLAVRSTGLTANNASRVRVLVNGASGGLGGLALQMLHKWGCEVTAICGRGKAGECVALGAVDARERGPTIIASLPSNFDAVLNFGSWDDDFSLASRLRRDALGHATTVHPLLENFDRYGWFRGALISRRQWKAGRTAVAERTPGARYDWTLFKPDSEALDVLVAGLRERIFSLPVGTCASFDNAMTVFAHVAAGKSGRAVLLPHGATPSTSQGQFANDRPTFNAKESSNHRRGE
jgi:reticulon-4-interacting protein 1, mitochondrial